MPKGSEALTIAYDGAIERIGVEPRELQELAKRVLSWVTFAKRPLSVLELQHALGVEIDEPYFDEENISEAEDMLSACAGLVTIDEESNIVRFVHYTTQEYFERILPSWIPDAQKDIANVCVTYLSLDIFANAPTHNPGSWAHSTRSEDTTEDSMQNNILLAYAAQYWGDHVRDTYDKDIEPRVLKFLMDTPKVIQVSLYLQKIAKPQFRVPMPGPGADGGMHLAAYFGLADTIVALLDSGCIADGKDREGVTPLSQAAQHGHTAVVEILLRQNDVEENSKDESGNTPLSMAAYYGHKAAVKLLLSQDDIEVNSKDNIGWSPLMRAVRYGHEAVVKLLLSQDDIEVNSKDNIGWSPLMRAVRYGHEAVVKLLLSQDDIKVNLKDNYGHTPLFKAVICEHEAVVKLLLSQKDIEVNSKDDYDCTSLMKAARYGHEAVVELLLSQKDIEVNSRDKKGRTPLMKAANNGYKAVVRILVQHGGVDVDAKDHEGCTAIDLAIRYECEAVVEILQQYTAGATNTS